MWRSSPFPFNGVFQFQLLVTIVLLPINILLVIPPLPVKLTLDSQVQKTRDLFMIREAKTRESTKRANKLEYIKAQLQNVKELSCHGWYCHFNKD